MSASLTPRKKLYNRYHVIYIFTHILSWKLLKLTRFSSIELFTTLVTVLLFSLSLILIFLFSLSLILILLTILLILYFVTTIRICTWFYIIHMTIVFTLLFDIGTIFRNYKKIFHKVFHHPQNILFEIHGKDSEPMFQSHN